MQIQGPHGGKNTILNLKSDPPPSHVVAICSGVSILKLELTPFKNRHRGASVGYVADRSLARQFRSVNLWNMLYLDYPAVPYSTNKFITPNNLTRHIWDAFKKGRGSVLRSRIQRAGGAGCCP